MKHIKVGVQLWPGGTPDYGSWRNAVLTAEQSGVDAIFGYDHFHRPAVEIANGGPQLLPEQPDVNNFEGWTALASWGEITSSADIGLLVIGRAAQRADRKPERRTRWYSPRSTPGPHLGRLPPLEQPRVVRRTHRCAAQPRD